MKPGQKPSVSKSNKWKKEVEARGMEVDPAADPYLTPEQQDERKNKWWFKIKKMLGYQTPS